MKFLSLSCVLLFSFCNLVAAQVSKMPFDFDGNHIYIKVLTGKSDSLIFVFDTGATGASIDSVKAENAGVSKENREIIGMAGHGGAQNYIMAKNQTFRVAGLDITGVNPILVNFDSFRKTTGMTMDGLLGYELLNRYVTQIDFDRKEMLFYNNIKEVITTGYTAIPFEFNRDILIPRFPVTIQLASGETFTGRVMFDSGGGFSLLVSTPFNKFHKISEKLPDRIVRQSRGLNTVSNVEHALIKSMKFNGFDLGEMSIDLTINDKAEPTDGYLGMIGIDIIKRFNLILDYANKTIYLKPNSIYAETQMVKRKKITFVQDNIKFLEQNKMKPGVKVTSSGLQYLETKRGSGAMPLPTDGVTIYFSFSLIDGKKIWKSFDRSNPWIHHIDKALPGMQEALPMMPVGSRWILYIPPELAFGQEGYEDIPSGAVIICELELVNIKK